MHTFFLISKGHMETYYLIQNRITKRKKGRRFRRNNMLMVTILYERNTVVFHHFTYRFQPRGEVDLLMRDNITQNFFLVVGYVVLMPYKSVCITIDPKDLNKALIRNYHPILKHSMVEEVAQRCPSSGTNT